VVAPLRVARGIQNKILEAMAMARPVVASESCAQAIHAETGTDLLDATSPADFITQISALLASAEHSARVGAAGRNRVLSDYSWFAHLSNINTHLNQKASV